MLLCESGCLLLRFYQVPVNSGRWVERVDATGASFDAGDLVSLVESGNDVHGYSSFGG